MYSSAWPSRWGLDRVEAVDEIKYLDIETNDKIIGQDFDTLENDPMKCLNGIAVGDEEDERGTHVIVMKSISIRGFVAEPRADGPTPIPHNLVRLSLVLDTQTNGAQMTGLEPYVDAVTDAQNVNQWRYLEENSRFKVLTNTLLHIKPQNMVVPGDIAAIPPVLDTFHCPHTYTPFEIHHDFGGEGKRVLYSGTGNHIGDIVDNSIHLIGVALQPSEATISYTSRLRWINHW